MDAIREQDDEEHADDGEKLDDGTGGRSADDEMRERFCRLSQKDQCSPTEACTSTPSEAALPSFVIGNGWSHDPSGWSEGWDGGVILCSSRLLTIAFAPSSGEKTIGVFPMVTSLMKQRFFGVGQGSIVVVIIVIGGSFAAHHLSALLALLSLVP